MKYTCQVNDMSCASCALKIHSKIEQIPGVENINIDPVSKRVEVAYDQNQTNPDIINMQIKNAGYNVDIESQSNLITYVLTIIAFLFGMVPMIMGISINANLSFWSQLLILAGIVWLNRNYFNIGLKAFTEFSPNMNSLILLATISVLLLSTYNYLSGHAHFYFETASIIIGLTILGKDIEHKINQENITQYQAFQELLPTQVNLKNGESQKIVPIDQVEVGSTIILNVGDVVPFDCMLLSNKGMFDFSSITGESDHIAILKSNQVLAGAIVKSTNIELKTLNRSDESSLSHIIESLNNINLTKPQITKVGDRIVKYFVPTLILIGLVTIVMWYINTRNLELAITYGLTVIVVACPCAIGLATPIALRKGTGALLKNNVIINNGEVFEKSGKIDTIVFDKTGTLTSETINVASIDIVEQTVNNEEILALIYQLEKNSNHPIAKSICIHLAKYEQNKIVLENINEIVSQGISARYNDDEYYIGKPTEITEANVVLNKNSKTIAKIYLNHQLKEDAKDTIKTLQQNNYQVIILSGDKEDIVRKTAQELGIDQYHSQVTPINKHQVVKQLKSENKNILMVGDGINDALALSQADMSLSFANASQVAKVSSDAIITTDSIQAVEKTLKLAKYTYNIIIQNYFWALGYNIVMIPIAAGLITFFGYKFTPEMAAIAMSISSISVVLNSQRIRK